MTSACQSPVLRGASKCSTRWCARSAVYKRLRVNRDSRQPRASPERWAGPPLLDQVRPPQRISPVTLDLVSAASQTVGARDRRVGRAVARCALSVLLLATGCRQILGLEDPQLFDGGGGNPDTPDLQDASGCLGNGEYTVCLDSGPGWPGHVAAEHDHRNIDEQLVPREPMGQFNSAGCMLHRWHDDRDLRPQDHGVAPDRVRRIRHRGV